MKIMTVKNYKTFAEMLRQQTSCTIDIKVLERDHIHYQLNKDGISLGVLCINKGEASFAPFVTHENAQNNQYISVQYMPMIDDFIKVLKVFADIFVDNEE